MKKYFISLMLLSVISSAEAAKEKSRFEELELFNNVLHLIDKSYYREVNTNKLIEGAIKGMMDTLDPHSAYLSKEYFKKMQNDTDGEFGGLGIEVTQKDGVIYVVTPIDDTPAYKAGVKPRDKIVEINHESILGFTLDEAVDRMKGKIGSKIHLAIVRRGEKGIKHFSIKRKKIKIIPVKSQIVEDNFAFIRLTQFQRKAASSIESSLKKLKKKAKKNGGLKGIILDLRSNPGGLLNQAVDVSSLFLKDGIVVSTEHRDPNEKEIHYVKKSSYKDLKTPMVVLVNGASASASEIVSGALQDHQRALIMGSQTFGKGSVQSVVQIDKDNGVKLTIAQYMTPKSRKIQAIGIVPDIKLSEAASAALQDADSEDKYLREKDLRNHLTATIETKEEKKQRLKDEKAARIRRAARIREMDKKNKNKSKEKDIFKKYNASDDYQVLQAVNYLRSFKVFDQFSKKQ